MEQLIKQAMAAAAGITLVPVSGSLAPLAAVPEGVRLKSLEQLMDRPSAIAGYVTLHRYSDFVAYVNDFKQEGARIFVSPDMTFQKSATLANAVLDYPQPGKPAWARHFAVLKVEPSLEYKLLTALESAGLHDQDKFALALRDLSRFCTSLSGADLLEIVQSLTVASKGEFASIQDDFTGSVRFGYDVQVTAKSEAATRKNVTIPQVISFNMPVLLGAGPVDLNVELLYRVPNQAGGKVQMGIRFPDKKFVERAVLEETADKLAGDTKLTVAVGDSSVPTSPGDQD